MLTAQPTLSADDIARIQLDTVSIPAQQIAPYLLHAAQGTTGQPGATAAAQLFANWKGDMPRDSAAAALYEVTCAHLIDDMVHPLLDKKSFDAWDGNQYAITKLLILRDALAHPGTPFFADATARDAAIVKAENEAYSDLKAFFGTTDTRQWQWGKLHQAHFDHPLTAVAILKLLLPNQSVARPGDSSTVNVGGSGNFTDFDYSQDSVPSMREIIDMSNLDASRFVTTTGESGEPFAPHDFDLLPLWDSGRYQPMDFSPAAVQANAEATLVMQP